VKRVVGFIFPTKLEKAWGRAVARAKDAGRAVLVSYTQKLARGVDPIAFFESASVGGHDAFYWEEPARDFAFVAVGTAAAVESSGIDRFAETRAAWKRLLEDAVVENCHLARGTGPVLTGGFSFDPDHAAVGAWKGFSSGSLVLPAIHLTRVNGATYLTVNAVVGGSDAKAGASWRAALNLLGAAFERARVPANAINTLAVEEAKDAAEWEDLVRTALERMRESPFEKVALARELNVIAARPVEVARALEQLRASYPGAYVFAAQRGGRCFLGATPERLVSLRDGRMHTMALAGTCRRGATPSEDARLGAALLASAKERHEHAVVVDMLRATLSPFSRRLEIPASPSLLKLKNVQHLMTPVDGHVDARATVLDFVAALHPTPAVGGLPRAEALTFIRESEGLERGWYAGPVGWIDASGEGEFAVALRCALTAGRRATVFAGCGIVADSHPETEYDETQLKAAAVLGALAYAHGESSVQRGGGA
jgi:isochorismate synthase